MQVQSDEPQAATNVWPPFHDLTPYAILIETPRSFSLGLIIGGY